MDARADTNDHQNMAVFPAWRSLHSSESASITIMQYWEMRDGDRCGTYSEDCPICGANLQREGLVDEIGLDHTYGEYACGSVSAIAAIGLSRSRSIVAAYVSDMCAEIAGLYTEDEI